MLVAVTCLHGRPAVSRIWLKHTLSLGVPVFAAVTEGDQENIALLSAHGGNGVQFVETENKPLGRKHNKAMDLARAYGMLGDPAWDGVILLPSDDFVSRGWLEYAEELLLDHDYIIPTQCGIFDTRNGSARLMEHGPSLRFLKFGAGIVLSRNAVEEVNPLWFDERPEGLDTNNHHRLLKAGINPYYASMKDLPVTDVKSEGNLSRVHPSHQYITEDRALKMLSAEDREAVLALCQGVYPSV